MHSMSKLLKDGTPPLTAAQQSDFIRRLNTAGMEYDECGKKIDTVLAELVRHYKHNRQWIDTQLMRHSVEVRGRFLDLLRKARNSTNVSSS